MDNTHRNDFVFTVFLSFVLFFSSTLIPIGLAYIVKRPLTIDEVYQAFMVGFSFFILGEILIIKWHQHHNDIAKGETTQQLERALKALETSRKMTVPLSLQSGPAHIAFSNTLARFSRDIEIEENKLSVIGESISRELYEDFWDQILKAQQVLNSKYRFRKSKRDSIRVFTSHSTPVEPWTTSEFGALLNTQREFVKEGGKVFRILIRNADFLETAETYALALKRIRECGVVAYYIDPNDKNFVYDKDYLLTTFGGHYYYMSWTMLPHEHQRLKRIYRCTIEIGQDTFLDTHWKYKWLTTVDLLRRKPDALLKSVSAGDARVLFEKPNEHSLELNDMMSKP